MLSETNAETKVKSDGPILVKLGQVTVRIYPRSIAGRYTAYEVADYSTGKRRLRSFANLAGAKKEANRLARLIGRGEATAAGMTNPDSASYGRAVELLKPCGVSLELAAATVAEACALLGSNRILETVRAHLAANVGLREQRPVADVLADFLEVKKARQLNPRYLDDLKVRLGRFQKDFATLHVHQIGKAQIQDWLDALKLEPGGYKNYRTVMGTFFGFAVARGWATANPILGVEKINVRNDGAIEVFTPQEMSRLLASAAQTNPSLLPVLLFGGFAGIRTAEIERLKWSDVKADLSLITIGADRAKTASRRHIPVSPNLKGWLESVKRDASGRVWPYARVTLHHAQIAVAEETGDDGQGAAVKWKSNALRHSFASYRFPILNDSGRLAAEMGNSPAMVDRHYRELVDGADAKKWWKITRASCGL